MPQVHFVKKARKDNPVAKKGESYYWWQFAFSSRSYSKTRPRPSQLTRSEFLGQMYGFQEDLEDLAAALDDEPDEDALSEFADEVSSKADDVRTLGEEQTEKRDNMPEALQDSDTGELLQTRSEACDTIADELDSASGEITSIDPDCEDIRGEIDSILEGVDWSFE